MHKKLNVWLIVLLVGGYITCQLIADIGATRFVQVGGLSLSAGTFVFGLTLTLRDLIHKQLGKKWAHAAISAAAVFNIFLSGYLYLMSLLPAPVWYANTEAWNTIFALVPAITIGSIIAEFISEMVDTEVYAAWLRRFKNAPQWSRVLVSNAISIPVDSLVFCTLAFSIVPNLLGVGGISLMEALKFAVGGQIIYKAAITIVSLPLIYLVKERTANLDYEVHRQGA